MLFRLICNLGLGSQTLLVLQRLPTEISDKDQTSQRLFLFKKTKQTKTKPTTIVVQFCFQVSPFLKATGKMPTMFCSGRE